jgi:hypothetical protein
MTQNPCVPVEPTFACSRRARNTCSKNCSDRSVMPTQQPEHVFRATCSGWGFSHPYRTGTEHPFLLGGKCSDHLTFMSASPRSENHRLGTTSEIPRPRRSPRLPNTARLPRARPALWEASGSNDGSKARFPTKSMRSIRLLRVASLRFAYSPADLSRTRPEVFQQVPSTHARRGARPCEQWRCRSAWRGSAAAARQDGLLDPKRFRSRGAGGKFRASPGSLDPFLCRAVPENVHPSFEASQ